MDVFNNMKTLLSNYVDKNV